MEQVFFDGWPRGWLERFGRDQIHFAPKQVLQVERQADVIFPGCFVELHQNINITAFPQAIPGRGSKQCQRLDAITL